MRTPHIPELGAPGLFTNGARTLLAVSREAGTTNFSHRKNCNLSSKALLLVPKNSRKSPERTKVHSWFCHLTICSTRRRCPCAYERSCPKFLLWPDTGRINPGTPELCSAEVRWTKSWQTTFLLKMAALFQTIPLCNTKCTIGLIILACLARSLLGGGHRY